MICNLRCVVLNILSEKGGRVRIILFLCVLNPFLVGLEIGETAEKVYNALHYMYNALCYI